MPGCLLSRAPAGDPLATVDATHVQGALTAVLDALTDVVDHLPLDTLDDPSGCGTWPVRALLNHILFEDRAHTALATAAAMPGPDAVTGHTDEERADGMSESWYRRGL